MPSNSHKRIIAIDPGRDKCGIAVLDSSGNVEFKTTVLRFEFEETLTTLLARFDPDRVAVGDGTSSGEISSISAKLAPGKIKVVKERDTTLQARELAWKEKPPGGLWRLVPRLFWPTPPNLDSWAAVVIGRSLLGI
jgi:RNase H-fold protein (predicted Holliday junction resolvase)